MSLTKPAEELTPEELTPAQERLLLIPTHFPEEEFDLPDQTPEDLGQTDEEVSA